MQHELILAGGGSGTADYLLPAAKKALESADCVIASERFLSLLEVKKARPMGNISRLLQELPELLETERIGIVVSGDPLLYSLCRTIQNRYPELEMQVIPGVGSLQLLGAAFGLTMEQAEIRSIHGRECSPGTIAYAVSEHAETFLLFRTQGPREIAQSLLAYGLADTEIFVGADLTYPTQRSGTARRNRRHSVRIRNSVWRRCAIRTRNRRHAWDCFRTVRFCGIVRR